MKTTHRIHFFFKKLHQNHYIPNHLIWDSLDKKWIPDEVKQDIEPINTSELLEHYNKAKDEIENSEAKDSGYIDISTTLFLPCAKELEEILENTTADISTLPE